jgi:hypothetical protein
MKERYIAEENVISKIDDFWSADIVPYISAIAALIA